MLIMHLVMKIRPLLGTTFFSYLAECFELTWGLAVLSICLFETLTSLRGNENITWCRAYIDGDIFNMLYLTPARKQKGWSLG